MTIKSSAMMRSDHKGNIGGHKAVEVTVSRIDNRLLLTRSNTAPHSMLVPGS